MNLYIVSVDLINGLYPIVLDVLSLISIFSGILVITTKNPIVSILFLISLYLVVAVYLIMVGMHFIGLSYILVYVGAISILFLFIIMLINIRISELQSNTNNSLPLTIIIGIFISYSLFQLLPYDLAILSNFNSNLNNNLYNIFINKEENNTNLLINTNKGNDLLFVSSKI